MKKMKSILSVLVLTLIFISAASVTKAEAADYKVEYSATGVSVNMYYLNEQASKRNVSSGTSVPEGTLVYANVTLGEGMGSFSVDGVTTKALNEAGFTFTMPAEAIKITITARASEKIDAEIGYADETIKVTCGMQIYYQVVKSEAPGTLKAANWIKAAYDAENKVYSIDFSSVANGKDAYFALTTNKEAVEATEVAVVDSVVKSIKVGLNYRTEEITNGLADVISTLNVKGVDGGDNNDKGTAAEYSLKWKRGANGKWSAAKDFDQLQWDMLKASNGTLYVAIDGKVKVAEEGKEAEVTSFRLSKEAKVKIPKSAKAPTVKVDFVKGTLALKNGMQVRVNDNTAWMDVIAYDKAAEDKGAFALATENLKTSKKVSTVLVDDFVAAVKSDKILNMTSIKAGDELTLEVRTAATDKKFPSMSGSLKIKTPATNPAVVAETKITYTKANKENGVEAEFIIDFTAIQSAGIAAGKYDAYEYILVDKAEDKVDFAKQKWTKCPADGKIDLSSKIGKTYTCALEGGTKATTKYEDTSVIYFRKAAVKADAKKDIEGVFASATAKAAVVITEKVVEAKKYAMGVVTDSVDAIVAINIDGKAVDNGEAFATEKAAITFTYKASADTKEVDSVKISYQEEDGEPQNITLTPENGVYSFTMPAADVTITVKEKDKETT